MKKEINKIGVITVVAWLFMTSCVTYEEAKPLESHQLEIIYHNGDIDTLNVITVSGHDISLQEGDLMGCTDTTYANKSWCTLDVIASGVRRYKLIN